MFIDKNENFMFKVFYRLLLFVFFLSPLVCNGDEAGEAAARRKERFLQAEKIYAAKKNGYNAGQTSIVDFYVNNVLKKEAGTSDCLEIMGAWDALYELCKNANQGDAEILFTDFNVDYTWDIPFFISCYCDNNNQTNPERLHAMLLKQYARCNDSRIADVVVANLVKARSVDDAITYCIDQIKKGDQNYYFHLASLRVELQKNMIVKAMKDAGEISFEPKLVAHDELKLALYESMAVIAKRPETIGRYEQIFYSAFMDLQDEDMAIPYYEFLLSQARGKAPADAKLRDLFKTHVQKLSGGRTPGDGRVNLF